MSEEWTTVEDEQPSLIVFDTIGDVWTGFYTGTTEILDPNKGETFKQLQFTGDDGKPYAINAGYQLRGVFTKIEPGTYCRITYVKDIDVGQPSPLRNFKVETRA